MIPYFLDGLPANLTSWMETRFLNPILSIEGGWEYWIQIDFPAWLDVYFNAQYDFRREVPIPGGRLDWLINSVVHGAPVGAIEIKAQTHKYPNTPFVQDVLDDMRKLSNLGTGYANKLMLAAVIDAGAYNTLVYNYSFLTVASYGEVAFLARSV